MAIFRVEKKTDFTIMSNNHFRDKNLSWKAKGLLSTILSLPEDWDYSLTGLTALSKDGRDSSNAAIKELEKNGYLLRRQIRENGKIIDWEYIVFEKPVTDLSDTEKPQTEKPVTDFPQLEKPHVENPKQLNTNIQSNNISITKELNIKEKESVNTKEKEKSIDEVIALQKEKLQEPLREFVKMRKSIKKPITTHGLELVISKLRKLSGGHISVAEEIINQSIMNGWQGVFALKGEDGKEEKPAFKTPFDIV